MKTLTVSLSDALDAFVQQMVSAGGYSSPSDVVREGLRLLASRGEERQFVGVSVADAAERGAERLRRAET